MDSTDRKGASVAKLAEFNRSKVVRALYRESGCSRAHIAEQVGLTPASVGQIITQLLDMGLARETGKIKGRGSRRAVAVTLDVDFFHVIGVKIGAGRVELCTFRLDGTPVSKTDDYAHWNYPAGTTPAEAMDDVCQWVARELDADPAIAAIGVAMPSGMELHPESAYWDTDEFRNTFTDAFDVPVYFGNDAKAGVFAQWMLSPASHGVDHLAYLMVGETIGLGVMERGSVINGAGGLASQIGHISINIDGKPCECGGRGCLRQYCCVASMLELIRRHPDLARRTADLGRRDACIRVFELAHDGNADAAEAVRTIGRYIGHACAAITNAYNPSRIIIGDFMARGGDILMDEVRGIVKERTFPTISDHTTITLNDMAEDPVLCGAGSLAIEAIFSEPTRFAELREGRLTATR